MSDNNAGLRRLLDVATDLVASLEACQREDYADGLDSNHSLRHGASVGPAVGGDGGIRADDDRLPLDDGLDIPSL